MDKKHREDTTSEETEWNKIERASERERINNI